MDELNIKDLENVQGGIVTKPHSSAPTNPGTRPGQQAVVHTSFFNPFSKMYAVETWVWQGNFWVCATQSWSETAGDNTVEYL